MHPWLLTAATLAALLAGCTERSASPLEDARSFIDRTPGARMFTGQGQMGIGSAGNSDGAGGPSQNPGIAPKY